MPNNTFDGIRIIDKAFNSRAVKYKTLDFLGNYFYEETYSHISSKTVRNYIKKLRDAGAPIVNERGMGYYYSEEWSLSENPLSGSDIESLRSVISILSQFKGFKYFNDAEALINKLQDKILKSEDVSVIFETVDNAKGIDYIDPVAISVREKQVLKLYYQGFNAKEIEVVVSPYKLVEYNSRWFLFGKTHHAKERQLGVYPLDRINKIEKLKTKFELSPVELIRNYFSDMIGVTNQEKEEVQKVIFRIFGNRSNYVETKPIHHSQKMTKSNSEFKEFELSLKVNQELISYFLGLTPDLEIIQPLALRTIIQEKYQEALTRFS